MSSQSLESLAGRYATALYALAQERGALAAVAADLRSLRVMLGESADLRRFIASPVLSRAEKRRGALAIAETAALSATTHGFLSLLAANRRLAALPAMIAAFARKLAEARGEAVAEAACAAALSDRQARDLAGALKAALGKDIAVKTTIDPAIIGGLVVRVGSWMIDNSIRTKLRRLRLVMKGIG